MKGGILFVSYNLWCVNNTKEITDFPQKVSFLLVLTSTVIHSDIDGIASAWRCVSYICALLKRFSSHSLFSWLDSFFFLPALFFATAILNLNFLARLLMTSTFFRGLSGIDLSAFLYFNSGFVSKKMMMKWMVVLLMFVFGCHKLFRPIFLYSCCFFFLEFIVLVWVFRKFIVPSFLSLWSLSCCIFDLLLIFLFSIGLTVILDCFHHFFFDLTT